MNTSSSIKVTGLLLATLLGLAAATVSAQVSQGTIAADALAARVSAGTAPVILDVRTPAEFSAGHIPGAVNIPVQVLQARLAELAGMRNVEVVLHCESGRRASYAAQVLHQAGFHEVVQLEGHMQAWRGGGLPTTPAGCMTC